MVETGVRVEMQRVHAMEGTEVMVEEEGMEEMEGMVDRFPLCIAKLEK